MEPVYGRVFDASASCTRVHGKADCQERPGRLDRTKRGCGKESTASMKNELYRSVSWLGSSTRTHLTHSATRYLILGIAAIFAAFLMVQAVTPAAAQTPTTLPDVRLAVDGVRLVNLSSNIGTDASLDSVDVDRPGIVRATIQGSNVRLVGLGEGTTKVTVSVTNGSSPQFAFTVRVSGAPPADTPTPIPTATATMVPTPVPTAPPTNTPTPTPRPVPTNTPTPEPEPTATPEPTNTPPPAPTAPPEPTATPEPEDEGGVGIVGIIIGLLVLAALGAGAYFIFSRRGGGDDGPAPYGGPTMNGDNGDDNGVDLGDTDDNGDADGDDGNGEDEEENRQ